MISYGRNIKAGAFPSRENGSVRKPLAMSLIELPVMIWLVLVVLLLPMLALATMTLKSALMNSAVQDGVQVASKGKTFESSQPGKPSVKQLADESVRNSASKFSGLGISSIVTSIVITPVDGGPLVRSTSKLAQPADTSKFLYQIETVVNGKISPLFPTNPGQFGAIPGLTQPVNVSYVGREMAEFPQGLDD